MARKIFISYKYGDTGVRRLPHVSVLAQTRVRDYVDLLQAHLDVNDHINKGELDGEDLSMFKDETIESRLRAKIHDSSITVVLMSKNMRDLYIPEEDQWIPWEISYSLKELTREGRTSGTNAILAVGLPDENDSYDHFIVENTCRGCSSKTIMTDRFFHIIQKNMFNRRQKKLSDCAHHYTGSEPHVGEDHSYIHPVKWDDFIANMGFYLDTAVGLKETLHEFDIWKSARP